MNPRWFALASLIATFTQNRGTSECLAEFKPTAADSTYRLIEEEKLSEQPERPLHIPSRGIESAWVMCT